MSDASTTGDLNRLRRCLGRSDEDAFEAIFDRLGTPVFRFISGMVGEDPLAHDLTQETFTRLWEARERMSNVDSLEAYVFQIARNRVYSHQRTERRRRDHCAEHGSELSGGSPMPDGEVAAQEVRAKLQEWIEDLPKRQREAFLLSREQDLSHEEIADVMDVSPNTVNNHIVKAMNTLRDRLKNFRPDLL